MKKISLYVLGFLAIMGLIALPSNANAFDFGSIAGSLSEVVSGGFSGGIMGAIISLFGFASAGFCWFCDLYKTLFDIMNNLATNVATGLKTDFLALLGLGVLFFIAFKVGSTVVKLQEVDLMQFMGDLFKQLGRAMIAAAFLYGTVEMYNYLLSPFLAYSLALTNKMLISHNPDGISDLVIKVLGGGKDGSGFIPAVSGNIVEGGGKAFSGEIRNQLIGFLELVSASLIAGLVIGAAIILIGFADAYLNIIPNFQIVGVGFIILGSYFAIYVAVPFKLIDVMVRLTFVAALTPLWIILWVFPATASYTKNAWEMLLNCCACIICLGVVLVIALKILEEMLPNKEDILIYLLSGLDMLATGQMNLINPAVLKTAALGMLVTNLIKHSSTIATQIVKSYGTSIGDGVSDAVTKGISSMGNVGAALGGAAAAVAQGGVSTALTMGRDATQGVKNNNVVKPFVDNLFNSNVFGTNPVRGASNALDKFAGKTEKDLTSEEKADRDAASKTRASAISKRMPQIEQEMKDIETKMNTGRATKGDLNDYAELKAEKDVLSYYQTNPNAGGNNGGMEQLQDRLEAQYKNELAQGTPIAKLNTLNSLRSISVQSDASDLGRSRKGMINDLEGKNNPQPEQPQGNK